MRTDAIINRIKVSSASTAEGPLWRRHYLRPLYLAILLSTLRELGIWVVWGLILFPSGDPIAKLTWVIICGLAMESVI